VDGGTIFLDEIGEMPLDTQAFLLRILESGEFLRVGSSKVQKTDVRIIAATNVDLRERVRKGKFREDLFYRLNTVPIEVPPLRERQEDIYMLFRKFVVDFAEKYRSKPIELNDQARILLRNYHWPGNIRELRNVAEQMSVLSQEKTIHAEELVEYIPNLSKRNLPALTDSGSQGANSMDEREILYKVLFEMQSDLRDLKSLVFELMRSNNLSVSDTRSLQHLQAPNAELENVSVAELQENLRDYYPDNRSDSNYEEEEDDSLPIIIDQSSPQYDKAEVVEENLSLEENEKELIRKALKKHNGRRKEAADDLGISERTLYRKIKQYEL